MLYTRTYIWVNVPHECLHFDPHQSPRVLTYTYSARAAHNFRGVANLGRGAVRPPRPSHRRLSQPENNRKATMFHIALHFTNFPVNVRFRPIYSVPPPL